MMVLLLGAGVGLLAAGLAAIGFGLPIKEFSFGSTMILSGVVATCSGAILLGLWVVARQLRTIALGLRADVSLSSQRVLEPAVSLQPGDTLFSREQPAVEKKPAVAPPARPGDTTLQDSAPDGTESAPAVPEAAPAPRPKRNLLFSSTSRRERERAGARPSETPAPDLLSPELHQPLSAPPPATELPESMPPSFDDAWPKRDRSRTAGQTSSAPPLRRSVRPTQPPAEDAAAPPNAIPGGEAPPQPQVTVLKSGVVDGMAYSLYSDGSIEAQMPEGMMRFASIDELRAHLDQRP